MVPRPKNYCTAHDSFEEQQSGRCVEWLYARVPVYSQCVWGQYVPADKREAAS